MRFVLPSEDQLALARGGNDYLAGEFPLSRFRQGENNVSDTARWSELADLGLFGISLPENEGGLGLSWLDEVLACREAGRYLISPALIGTVLAVRLANNDDDLQSALLTGSRCAGIAMKAGNRIAVIDGVALNSDALYVLVELEAVSLHECSASGLSELGCIDETVKLHRADNTTPAKYRLENKDLADPNLSWGANLMVAAMLCGLLEATCEMAADYARTRVQFGRPIGAFQAIKHRCADIALATELCWSQVLQATQALETGADDTEFQIKAAKFLAGDEALKAARFNIQAHGGMGFTDEVDAHRLMKRAHVLHQLLGDPRALQIALSEL